MFWGERKVVIEKNDMLIENPFKSTVRYEAELNLDKEIPGFNKSEGELLAKILDLAIKNYLSHTVVSDYKVVNADYSLDTIVFQNLLAYELKLHKEWSLWQILKSIFSLPTMGISVFTGPGEKRIFNLVSNYAQAFIESGARERFNQGLVVEPGLVFNDVTNYLKSIKN